MSSKWEQALALLCSGIFLPQGLCSQRGSVLLILLPLVPSLGGGWDQGLLSGCSVCAQLHKDRS